MTLLFRHGLSKRTSWSSGTGRCIVLGTHFSTTSIVRNADPDPRLKNLGHIIKDDYANLRAKYRNISCLLWYSQGR